MQRSTGPTHSNRKGDQAPVMQPTLNRIGFYTVVGIFCVIIAESRHGLALKIQVSHRSAIRNPTWLQRELQQRDDAAGNREQQHLVQPQHEQDQLSVLVSIQHESEEGPMDQHPEDWIVEGTGAVWSTLLAASAPGHGNRCSIRPCSEVGAVHFTLHGARLTGTRCGFSIWEPSIFQFRVSYDLFLLSP